MQFRLSTHQGFIELYLGISNWLTFITEAIDLEHGTDSSRRRILEEKNELEPLVAELGLLIHESDDFQAWPSTELAPGHHIDGMVASRGQLFLEPVTVDITAESWQAVVNWCRAKKQGRVTLSKLPEMDDAIEEILQQASDQPPR